MILSLAQQSRVQILGALNTACALLAQKAGGFDYGVDLKTQSVQSALSALRAIGFGKETDSLKGTGLHVTVADWLSRNGINVDPLPPTPVVKDGSIHFGEESLSVSLQRTLRVADDGTTHKLPPNLRSFPVREVKHFQGKVSEDCLEKGGVLVPMWQREALWFCFSKPGKRLRPPIALMIASGMINAVSGGRWSERMNTTARSQNYVVAPQFKREGKMEGQPWLDGWNAGRNKDGRDIVRQFVAMPLGMGYTVEAQITGQEHHGGIQLLARRMTAEAMAAYLRDPINRLIADLNKPLSSYVRPLPSHFLGGGYWGGDMYGMRGGAMTMGMTYGSSATLESMGLAAGGDIEQQIFKDPLGLDVWDQSPEATGRLWIHLVNSTTWRAITDEEPPPTPVTPEEYKRHGYPWFDYYREAPSANRESALASVPGLAETDAKHGFKTDAAAPSPGGPVIVLNPNDPSQVTGVTLPEIPDAKIQGGADQGIWPTDKAKKK